MQKLLLLASHFLLIIFSSSSMAQEQQVNLLPHQEEMIQSLDEYFAVQREAVYLHLNKNLFLKGEQLGFSAYVLNKHNLQPSFSTTNLYVQIKDPEGEVVKEELLLVNKGIASGVVNIDSDFSSGNYTVTAFTNYMRNFKEQDFFSESIQVLESNIVSAENRSGVEKVDAQFLPESGHLLSGILNNVGVIVKDSLG
ncbi:hypothetical protein [Salinimicrobium sediminilitoris]|uniref:hypothetical protein n=1 Tax=Salinimicrobium sediminilitoris TaxID=2876715 RepID=UPI001E5F5D97|nr:hypothetical protein [Salinimicrobium sediminilitoris]MCC8359735.1 hypothetical protein [Salinimicrobium sediminilitoris]